MSTEKADVVEGAGTLLDAVLALNNRALARMWCDLNCWEWPRDLSVAFKPGWWDDGGRGDDMKRGLNHVLMEYAASRASSAMIDEEWRALQSHRASPTKAKSPKRSRGGD